MSSEQKAARNPMSWIPSLYFAEGIPYVVVMTVAVVLYKRMGISNADIAFFTSLLYLPWVIKPLWSPFVDLLRTKRFWIVLMQLALAGCLGGVALGLPMPLFFPITLSIFAVMAFASATHDIAADGFYMLGLSEKQQAFYVGVRSTFYRCAMITGQGLLVMLAGFLESRTGLDPVEVEVRTSAEATSFPEVDAERFRPSTKPQEQCILVSGVELEIGTEPCELGEFHALWNRVASWNREHGFVPGEWEKKDEEPEPAKTGAPGLLAIRLAHPPEPEKQIVVTLDRVSGDKSIALLAGMRLSFDSSNCDQPAYALFQIDEKLRGESSTTFVARAGNIPLSWSIIFAILAGLFILFGLYHRRFLPYPASDGNHAGAPQREVLREFWETFAEFFRKKEILAILAFLLLYRFAEAQLVKLAQPFMLDMRVEGGLGLTTGEVGFVYGTVGILALTAGGILGGIAAARKGLRYWLWWMAIAINIPNAVYVYLSQVQPQSYLVVNLCVAVEQFGYGFGFTAYMLFMIYVSRGAHKTAHFAITTGFMALGMMLPGMVSGAVQEWLGYQSFFVWILLATIPAFAVCALVRIDPEFGRKRGVSLVAQSKRPPHNSSH